MQARTLLTAGTVAAQEDGQQGDSNASSSSRWRTKMEKTARTALRQLDIVLIRPYVEAQAQPADDAVEQVLNSLRQLTSRYRRIRVGLAAFVSAVAGSGGGDSGLVAIGLPGAYSDDAWHIERGVLLLEVGKETYERLGIVGRREGESYGASSTNILYR